jgi:hypothetical protein
MITYRSVYKYFVNLIKNSIKTDGRNQHVEDKGKPKERPKDAKPARTKEGKETSSCDRKLSHSQPLKCCLSANHEI